MNKLVDVLEFGFAMLRGDEHSLGPRPTRSMEVILSLLESGASTLAFGGREERPMAGRVHAHWGAIPHQTLNFEPGTRFLVLLVPLPWFLSWGLPGGFVARILQGGFIREQDRTLEPLDRQLFARWEKDLAGSDRLVRELVLGEVRCRFARLAMAVDADPVTGRGDLTPWFGTKVDMMVRFVSDHYHEPIDVGDVVAAAGLDAKYGMKLFRKVWGKPIGAFLLDHRMWHAQRLLLGSQLKVDQIARESGFSTVSQFYDSFNRRVRMAPVAFRRANQLAAKRATA